MIEFQLNDKLDLMIFECTLFRVDNGEESSINLNLALDTGCTQTIIIPQYIKAVGYDIKSGKR
ncbi:MAG: hypothetical protein EAZ85_03445 [Bacteroidetes bacterium]|nr:MAG: hypothetical protein EAZ85_03445 [Bacteroidota bacterium]